jgi:hypothetical protein
MATSGRCKVIAQLAAKIKLPIAKSISKEGFARYHSADPRHRIVRRDCAAALRTCTKSMWPVRTRGSCPRDSRGMPYSVSNASSVSQIGTSTAMVTLSLASF